MNFYQFHIGDFNLHTAHLTLEEEAVYRRLLDYYYDTESPIPEETQLVIRRLRLGSYKETVALILNEFFILEPDGWHNLRADIEISEYNKKAERARENGKKGGRPKKNKGIKTQSVPVANPEETGSKANQEPVTINQEPERGKNSLAKFLMTDQWIPDQQSWEANRFMSGSPNYNQQSLHEFRLYWMGESKYFTESQWQTKLINSLKRNPTQPDQPARRLKEL
jgi:uncharacterized protein YdaU (DUF1376 family)